MSSRSCSRSRRSASSTACPRSSAGPAALPRPQVPPAACQVGLGKEIRGVGGILRAAQQVSEDLGPGADVQVLEVVAVHRPTTGDGSGQPNLISVSMGPGSSAVTAAAYFGWKLSHLDNRGSAAKVRTMSAPCSRVAESWLVRAASQVRCHEQLAHVSTCARTPLTCMLSCSVIGAPPGDTEMPQYCSALYPGAKGMPFGCRRTGPAEGDSGAGDQRDDGGASSPPACLGSAQFRGDDALE